MAWLLDLCPPEYRTYPTLRRHAGVRDCVVIAREDAGQPRHLVAYAVPTGQRAPNAAAASKRRT